MWDPPCSIALMMMKTFLTCRRSTMDIFTGNEEGTFYTHKPLNYAFVACEPKPALALNQKYSGKESDKEIKTPLFPAQSSDQEAGLLLNSVSVVITAALH